MNDTNLPQVVDQLVIDDPIPVRHFEPSPLLEVPPPDKEPPEVTRQYPVHSAGNPNIPQDPFDTQMEVPFAPYCPPTRGTGICGLLGTSATV